MPQSYSRVRGELKDLLPMGSRIVVRPHVMPKYKGSIILPGNVTSMQPTTGTVVALGFALQHEEYPIHEGDQIVYGKYGGVDLELDNGSHLLVIHEDDVLAIISGEGLQFDESSSGA